jgi:hypothetical protein
VELLEKPKFNELYVGIYHLVDLLFPVLFVDLESTITLAPLSGPQQVVAASDLACRLLHVIDEFAQLFPVVERTRTMYAARLAAKDPVVDIVIPRGALQSTVNSSKATLQDETK